MKSFKNFLIESDVTNTPEFKRWFGNSKVVDDNGKPLIVYHGTRYEFNEFESSHPRGAIGNPKGVYFSPSKDVAIEYADDVDGAIDNRSRIISAYLSINSDKDGKVQHSAYSGTEYVVFDTSKIKIISNYKILKSK